jgi:hypothetical protein
MTREELVAFYAAGNRDFVGKDLRNVDLSGLDLSSANFRGASFRGANLQDTNLQDTNLQDTNLRDAYFQGVNFRGANLRDADLEDTDLEDTDLEGANLRGTDLEGANLQGARLKGAVGFRYDDAPDPIVLRKLVADQIEAHPERHDQGSWGDGTCETPCCVAGWACLLGGGRRKDDVASAGLRLLWVDGLPMPSFSAYATREDILEALRATL